MRGPPTRHAAAGRGGGLILPRWKHLLAVQSSGTVLSEGLPCPELWPGSALDVSGHGLLVAWRRRRRAPRPARVHWRGLCNCARRLSVPLPAHPVAHHLPFPVCLSPCLQDAEGGLGCRGCAGEVRRYEPDQKAQRPRAPRHGQRLRALPDYGGEEGPLSQAEGQVGPRQNPILRRTRRERHRDSCSMENAFGAPERAAACLTPYVCGGTSGAREWWREVDRITPGARAVCRARL